MIEQEELAGGVQQVADPLEARPHAYTVPELPMKVMSEFRQTVLASGDITKLLFDHFRTAHNFGAADFMVETVENFSRELDAEDDEEGEYNVSFTGYEREPVAMMQGMLLGWVIGLPWLEDEELEYLPRAREIVDEELREIDAAAENGPNDQESWRDIIFEYGRESLDGFGAIGQGLAYYVRRLGYSPDLWPISEAGAGLMLKTLAVAKYLSSAATGSGDNTSAETTG